MTRETDIQPGDEGISSPSDQEYTYVLFATILDKDRKIAVINDRVCQEGDILQGGALVQAIQRGDVILIFKDQIINLSINPSIKKINDLKGEKNEI